MRPHLLARRDYLWAVLLILALPAGCTAPTARVRSTSSHFPILSRSAMLAKQLVADTAVCCACRPWETGHALGAASADWLWAAGEGVAGKRVELTFYDDPPSLADDRPKLDRVALESDLRTVAGNELQPARIQIYRGAGEALAALKQTIDQAQHRIDVLMFIWGNDRVGAEIASWLAAKAGPDLPVRVLVDGGGNLIFGVPEQGLRADVNAVVRKLAEHPYVEVIRIRHPFGQLDHRKLVIVDGRVAWTGGRNFYDYGFFGEHDLCFTVSGPLVAELQADFGASWEKQGGAPLADALRTHSPPDRNSADPNTLARVIRTEPGRDDLAQALYLAVDHARHHIYLENPYLFDSRMVCKLARARRRGVDVRAVLTNR